MACYFRPINIHDDALSKAMEAALPCTLLRQSEVSAKAKQSQIYPITACQKDTCSRDFYSANFTRPSCSVTALQTRAAVAVAPSTAFDEEEITPWRLDQELKELCALKDAITSVDSLDQKLQVLNRSPSVKATFGDILKNKGLLSPIILLALEQLDEYEVYLLKCLVAGGQGHVLQATPTWLNHLDKSSISSQNGAAQQKAFEIHGDIHVQHVEIEAASLEKAAIQGTLDGKNVLSNGSPRKGVHITHPASNVHHPQLELVMRALESLIGTLRDMESFYGSIGGIIGYQATALELIKHGEVKSNSRKENGNSCIERPMVNYCVPAGPDLSQDIDYAQQAAAWGLEALTEMGAIYPLGGAGDRLGLVDELTGECLPVAMLPYCGRTLLEGLIRDLQAKEFLYFKVYGEQVVTPVAIMTSAAKKNHELVMRLCERKDWFGRGKLGFFLFEQPLIPAVAAEDGHWLISEPLTPILKPGGHGVIWKLAFDKGVFDWFYKKGRKAAIVRQISNPIAATDVTLLALAGVGHHYNKKFGFASCQRKVGAAEGVNVLVEKTSRSGWEYAVTCIEYTEFNKLGIPDTPVSPGSMQAQFPANTNVLYVDLPSVEKIASSQSSQSLPGMILNLKKPIVYKDYLGCTHSTYAGRMECTMQNIADLLVNRLSKRLAPNERDYLDTFVVYNQRRKVTSSAKRRRKLTDFSLHQTPDGSFLDVTRNGHELLSSCMIDMPEMESSECYIEFGPRFIVLLHPAIGPLWSIVRQKIRGGSIRKGSELQLEIAEILWQDVQLDGSLLVHADNVVGSVKEVDGGERLLQYGDRCGRCKLERVRIRNRGVNWGSKGNVYWQHKVDRFESLKIVLRGNAEFEAQDVILEGPHTFEVPDGYRMTVAHGRDGISCALHALGGSSQSSWQWRYTLQDGGLVHLDIVEN